MNLTPQEQSLLALFRALPEGEAQATMLRILGSFAHHVKEPRCLGMGVEGFPCGEPPMACEDCHKVWDLVDRLASPITE